MVTKLLVAALLLTMPVVAGCQDDDGTAEPGGVDRYVALGDSFTSGAGLPKTRRDGTSCGQSSLNYPSLVAKSIGAKLVDVSCGGATTDNGTQPQLITGQTWPPQLDAVTKSTDLVTVSLGGNDFSWYLAVMFGCTSTTPRDPTGNPCELQGSSPESDLTALPAKIGPRVEALLDEVHRKAPAARVLLVGYPQPVPAEGSCPELPLATGDYAFVRAQCGRDVRRRRRPERGPRHLRGRGRVGQRLRLGAGHRGAVPPAGRGPGGRRRAGGEGPGRLTAVTDGGFAR